MKSISTAALGILLAVAGVAICGRFSDRNFFERRLAERYQSLNHVGLQELLKDVGAHDNSAAGKCNEAELASNDSCLTSQCMNAHQLLTTYGLHHTGLSIKEIRGMSASLLFQSSSGLCSGDLHAEEDEKDAEKPPRVKAWGYGFLAVTLINCASIMGFFFKPCMNTKAYNRIMMYMVSLAVGTLSGSSLMFLIPESFEFADSDEYADIYAWKLACVCGGIYMFFLTERLLTMLMQKMDKKKGTKTVLPIDIPPSLNLHTETKQDHQITPFEKPIVVCHEGSDGKVDCKDVEDKALSSQGHSHGENIKTVAWMIIIGDAIHNFMDGLSLGAAFSTSIMGGVSVSVAVFCEELPHELGDFAVLLNSGMTVKQAVAFNFSSACTCYLGFVCGIIIGEMTSGSSWVFVITAGMFLYIALVDMLPEVNAAAEEEIEKGTNQWTVFLVQNLGLLSGWGAMLILAKIGHIFDFE